MVQVRRHDVYTTLSEQRGWSSRPKRLTVWDTKTSRIAEANRQVRAIQQEKKHGQKKGQYNCYSEPEHAAMGKYACQHGATAAAKYFSKEFGVVNSRIIIAGARGILFSSNRSLLAERGGPIVLSQSWAQSLLKRMDFVRRKETTAKSKWTGENFQRLKQEFLEEIQAIFLEEIQAIITMEEIPPDLGTRLVSRLSLCRHGRWRNVGLSR